MEKRNEGEKKFGVEELIQKGKKNNGMLSSADIEEVIEELDYDMESVDKLYETLENNGISWQSDADQNDAAEIEREVARLAKSENMERILEQEGLAIDEDRKSVV